MLSSMACSVIGPDWVSLVKRVLGSRDLLRFYGAPAILNHLGFFDVSIDGVDGFKWDYGGIYEVVVNGGELVSEAPLEPSREVPLNVNVLDVREIVSGLIKFIGSSGQPGIFNPLGWKPIAPLLLEGGLSLSGCIRVDDTIATPIDLEPLHSGLIASCPKPPVTPGRAKIKLGVFNVNVEGDFAKTGFLTLVKGGGYALASLPGALTMKADGSMEVTVEHPYRDYNVSLMHILSFYKFKGDGLFRGVSAVIEGPRGSLAVASPRTFEITAYKGFVTLRFEGELSLAPGGYVEASRLLIERAVRWSVHETPSSPLGHVRSYRVQPILTSFEGEVARFAVVNPTMADGVFEVKTYYPLLEARFSTLGGWVEMRVLRDSITIPSPRGYCGLVEVKIGRAPLVSR